MKSFKQYSLLLVTCSCLLAACGGNKETVTPEDELAAAREENANNELFTGENDPNSVDIFGDGTRVYNRDAEAADNDIFGVPDVVEPTVTIGDATLYFDYNSAQIREDARAVVVANAKHLAENADARVVLEGHADERGTREYNIALGMRRAEAVRQLMMLYGVEPKQIRLTSYGEERPVADGHNEIAWAQNRRVELKYPY